MKGMKTAWTLAKVQKKNRAAVRELVLPTYLLWALTKENNSSSFCHQKINVYNCKIKINVNLPTTTFNSTEIDNDTTRPQYSHLPLRACNPHLSDDETIYLFRIKSTIYLYELLFEEVRNDLSLFPSFKLHLFNEEWM